VYLCGFGGDWKVGWAFYDFVCVCVCVHVHVCVSGRVFIPCVQ
jgi:hypothetical protein